MMSTSIPNLLPEIPKPQENEPSDGYLRRIQLETVEALAKHFETCKPDSDSFSRKFVVFEIRFFAKG
jgi:hypothetical protein